MLPRTVPFPEALRTSLVFFTVTVRSSSLRFMLLRTIVLLAPSSHPSYPWSMWLTSLAPATSIPLSSFILSPLVETDAGTL